MAYGIFLSRRHRRQPERAAHIREYWLRRGLVFLFNGATYQDLVTGEIGTESGGPIARRVLPNGDIGPDIVAASSQYLEFASSAIRNVKVPISIFWRGVFDSVGGGSGFRCIVSKAEGNGATNTPFDWYLNTTTGYPTFVRSNTQLRTKTWGAAPAAGELVTLFQTGTYPIGGTGIAYKNSDVQTFSDAGAGIGFAESTTNGLRIGRRQDGVTQLDGSVGCLAIFDQEVSAEEYFALYNDFWGEILHEPRLAFYSVASGTAYTLTATQATFTETGNAANLLKGNVVLTATGSFVETGNAANLVKTSVLATAVGAFTETGNDANLTKQWALVADVASFVLTGNDATLDYSGDTHPPLVAASGSYTLTGNAAGLAHGYVLTTEVGTFTETGNDVTLKVGNALVTEVGAFVLTGNDSTLTKASVLSLEKGTFIMTGRNANLIWSGAGGSTVEFFRGVSKAPDGGVSKTIHTLVDGGGGTYVVTESSGVSEDKTDSPNYEGYIIT